MKSEETQGAAMVFRVREFLIRQRIQAINALRGQLAEFGQMASKMARIVWTLMAGSGVCRPPAMAAQADHRSRGRRTRKRARSGMAQRS